MTAYETQSVKLHPLSAVTSASSRRAAPNARAFSWFSSSATKSAHHALVSTKIMFVCRTGSCHGPCCPRGHRRTWQGGIASKGSCRRASATISCSTCCTDLELVRARNSIRQVSSGSSSTSMILAPLIEDTIRHLRSKDTGPGAPAASLAIAGAGLRRDRVSRPAGSVSQRRHYAHAQVGQFSPAGRVSF